MAEVSAAVKHLRSPATIRERCHHILELGRQGRLQHFAVDEGLLGVVADFVLSVTKENYPDLDVPYHSRWQHFNTKARDGVGALKDKLKVLSADEHGQALYDLVIISVLLDAGAGMQWRYRCEEGEVLSKSEGLAVASYDMFMSGAFSSNEHQPMRVDGARLRDMTSDDLARGFQVSKDNPLVGLEGRTALLKRLGRAIAEEQAFFGTQGRLGGLYSYIAWQAKSGVVQANVILDAVLSALGGIWPGRLEVDGVNLGDVWRHPGCEGFQESPGLIPFHKLSQWLSYSLIEPLEWNGIRVKGVDQLTGLPEYRNGGLFIDMNVLKLKDTQAYDMRHLPDSELIVEWRALTVALLDEVGELVRKNLGKSAEEFPLAKVLQGGTWAAGRKIAREKRADGGPPLDIVSDGTVF